MKKNILLIVLDGCRAQSLGCYGYTGHDTSPNIDALAENGVVAMRNYATSFCTMPSVISMMTGQYPCSHKATATWGYYGGEFPFLTDILRANGYQTFGVSNNLTAMSPEWGFIRGYDRYYRVGKESNWFRESKEEQRGVKKPDWKLRTKRALFKELKERVPEAAEAVQRRAQLTWYEKHDKGGNAAVDCFGEMLITRDNQKPFFMYVNLPETHHPYLAPAPFNGIWGTLDVTDSILMLMFDPDKFYSGCDLTEEEISSFQTMYDTCVRYVDHLVGKLVNLLKNANVFDDTAIVLVGDHGGMVFEKNQLYGSTCFTYEPEIRVPFIVADHSAGRVKQVLTSLVDVFPTMLDIAEVSNSQSFQNSGKTLFSQQEGHPEVLIDYPAYPAWLARRIKDQAEILLRFAKTNRTMVTADGDKLIWVNDGKHERYNLNSDLLELSNLFTGAEKDFVLMERMTQKYQSLVGDWGRHLEYYPHNDVGQGMTNLPPLKNVNPEFDPASIRLVGQD